jgi:hypothetical protein
MVRLARIERATTCLEGRCSIQLSYRRNPIKPTQLRPLKMESCILHPVGMSEASVQPTASQSEKDWQKTQYSNLIRYIPSGTYYARLRVKGKLIRRSLKTDFISVAKFRIVRFREAGTSRGRNTRLNSGRPYEHERSHRNS